MKSLALYTAIFSLYDELQPQPELPGVDYLCFTDQPLQSDQYRIIPCPPLHSDPVRASRLPKILPHLFLPQYDLSIWHDANMQFQDGKIINRFRTLLQDTPFILFDHPYRNCIYEEAEWCLHYQKDTPKHIEQTLHTLQNNRYPRQAGLCACGLMARKHHHPEVLAFSNAWWAFYQGHSRRDQLSFNYIAQSTGLPFQTLPINIYDNEFLTIHNHLPVNL